MNGQTARSLGDRLLALESRRTAVRQRYFHRIADEISPIVAARFLQVDNQIQLLLDLQIASEIPLIQPPR